MKGNRDTQLASGKALAGAVLYSLQERNPAVSFSLSLFIWGGGQFYNRQMKAGIMLLLMMTAYSIFLVTAVVSRGSIRHLVAAFDPDMNSTEMLFVFVLVCLSGMVICFFNAWQAYYSADKLRSKPFKGTKNVFYPFLCSLLVPGWGQFLNGQFKKGIFFQLTAAAGFCMFPVMLLLYHFWPVLEHSTALHYLGKGFAIWMVMVPFMFLMWILCIYDAVKVCLNDRKKEPLLKRISYISSRVQMEGVVDGMLSRGKQFVMLSLFLILLLIISCNYMPREFYAHQLHKLEVRLSQREMVIAPELINRFQRSFALNR